MPKSPSTLDPYRYAQPDAEGKLVVPSTAPPVVRRNYILQNLSTSRWTSCRRRRSRRPSASRSCSSATGRCRCARALPRKVRRQLDAIIGDGPPVETGGYQVITTLNWDYQAQAERWLTASVIAPNLKSSRDSAGASSSTSRSTKRPRLDQRAPGQDLHNASLVALDYRTGDVIAYAGSAGYYNESLASPKFEPKYDVAGDGERQPGSAWKPIVYASAFDTGALSAGSLLLDITTEFDRRQDWAPRDADQLDRGPVLVRKALQYSLNVPAIRALGRVGNEAVADRAEAMGIRFHGGREAFLQSGLAGAIGTVEVRPLDLTAGYAAIANGGAALPPRMILEVRDASGTTIYQAPTPGADPGDQPAGRVHHHEHPDGQHRAVAEPDLGGEARAAQRTRRAPTGRRRSRPGRRTRPATSRRTATLPRRRIRPRRRSRSGSGWATATTRTRSRRRASRRRR